jgi:hypothetical protein
VLLFARLLLPAACAAVAACLEDAAACAASRPLRPRVLRILLPVSDVAGTSGSAGAAAEAEEEEGLGSICTSEESEGDDSGFICAALRFVPWVDTSAAAVAGVVKEVVALFLLAAAEDERTDEEERAPLAGATGSAIAAALLRGVRCELIRAAFDCSAAAAVAAIPAPDAAPPRRPELPPSLSFSASGPFCPAVSAAGVVREEADAEVVERPLGSDGTPACESHSICLRKTRVCSEAA